MAKEQVNALYEVLTETAAVLQEHMQVTYLDALLETSENLLEGQIPENQKQMLGESDANVLLEKYNSIQMNQIAPENKRKALQLAMLKGMKEEFVQPNHQMTPDSLGQLMGYFIQLFFEKEEQVRVVDFGVGSGNLLSVVSSTLEALNKKVIPEGIEVDELLISLASVNFAFQDQEVRLTHQDALTNLLIQPADIVVSDLPIGFYPQDDIAATFDSSFDEGHSYAHYLFIEQGLKYLKANGLGLFLVPGNMFEEEKAKAILDVVQDQGYIQAIIQMPEEWFQNKKSIKNLLIVQKKGDQAKQASEVLFAKAPDFKNQYAVTKFLAEIRQWKKMG